MRVACDGGEQRRSRARKRRFVDRLWHKHLTRGGRAAPRPAATPALQMCVRAATFGKRAVHGLQDHACQAGSVHSCGRRVTTAAAPAGEGPRRRAYLPVAARVASPAARGPRGTGLAIPPVDHARTSLLLPPPSSFPPGGGAA